MVCSKSKIFSSLFLIKVGVEIMLSPKNGYFPNPWCWAKNPNFFFCSLFSGKIGVEIMLSYGLERKKGFEDDKIVNFVKVQNMDIFQRG